MCDFSVNLTNAIAGLYNSSKDGVRMSDYTPGILLSIGMDDLPMMIGIKHCINALNEFDDYSHIHGIPFSTFIQVPDFLEKPVFIFDSDKRRDTVVAVLDLYDPMNQPIMVCIHCNGDQDGEEVHYVTGLYGKRCDGIMGQYSRAVREDRLLYIDSAAMAAMIDKIHMEYHGTLASGIIKQSDNAAIAKTNRNFYNRRYQAKKKSQPLGNELPSMMPA